MAFADEKVLTDVDGIVVPQYWNKTTQKWEPVEGENGAYYVQYVGTSPQPPNGDIDGGSFLDSEDGNSYDGGEF